MTLVRQVACVVLLTFCACYPYLPGEYDDLAVTLSLVAQAGALAGLLLVPIGVLWLALEVRHRRYLAIGAACGYLTVAAVVTVVAWVSSGLTFACVMLALSAYGLPRLVPPAQSIDAGLLTPLRLTVVPLATFLRQVLLADPLAGFSRGRAIASSASLIDDIERYRAAYGQYPPSLAGVWPDYTVSVVGIEQFRYARHGDAYNLYFEQPVPLLDAPGTREFVVYNTRGEHLMLSHAAWNLTGAPEQLAGRQGWYAVIDSPHPCWKRFRFD